MKTFFAFPRNMHFNQPLPNQHQYLEKDNDQKSSCKGVKCCKYDRKDLMKCSHRGDNDASAVTAVTMMSSSGNLFLFPAKLFCL